MDEFGKSLWTIAEPALRPSTSDTKEDRVGDHVGGIESGLRLRLVAITSSSASFMRTSGGRRALRTRFLLASSPMGTVTGDWGRRGAWHAEAMTMGGLGLGGERELRTERKRDETKEFVSPACVHSVPQSVVFSTRSAFC